jgi:ABC-type xylose transport system substrate-binding protein
MFPGIGRMEDIWASYYAQAQGLKVIYGPPSVFQKRNFHDYTIDFENEYIGYLKTFSLIKDLKDDPENIKKYIPLRSYLALKEYQKFFDKN